MLPDTWTAETSAARGAAEAKFTSQPSATCGEIAANSKTDFEHAHKFCSEGVASGVIVGVIAHQSILTLKVTELMAREMRADRLRSEQLVRNWIKLWRGIWGRPSVTVEVEWNDVRIATGDTTVTAGDRVRWP